MIYSASDSSTLRPNDFVRALAEDGLIIPVYDLNELENILKNGKFPPLGQRCNDKLVKALRNYIVELSGLELSG